MLRFFQYVFVPSGTIAQIINIIILSITSLIMFWLIVKYFDISSAIKRMKFLNDEFEESSSDTEESRRLTREGIIELINQDKYLHIWLIQKVSAISTMIQDNSSARKILGQVNAEIEWKILGRLKYPISSLIVFGLLGTIWGLQEAVYSLKPTVSGALDFEQLKLVMSATLSGMQTAFSTTLAGLFASICVGFFASFWLKNKLIATLLEQDDLIIKRFMPVLSTVDESQIESLIDHTDELKKAIGDLAQEGQNIFHPIVEAMQFTREAMDKIYGASLNFVKTNENISEMVDMMSETFRGFSSKLDNVEIVIKNYDSLQEEIKALFEKVAEMPQSIESVIVKLGDGLEKKQIDLMSKVNTDLTKMIKTVDHSIDGLAKTIIDFKTISENKKDELIKDIDELLKKTVSFNEKLEGKNEKLDQKYLTTIEHTEDLLNKYEEMRGNVKKTYEANLRVLADQIENMTKKLNTDQTHRNEQLLRVVKDWANYNKYLGESLVEFKSMPEKLEAVLGGNGNNKKMK